ncbi:MAG: SPFH domain-containing protein, partial [Acidimicrobiia bacterium]
MLSESTGRSGAGIPWLIADVVLFVVDVALYVLGGIWGNLLMIILAVVLSLLVVILSVSFFVVQPNQSAVLTLFGDYKGSDRVPGLRIANPLYLKKKVSLRVRNFTTQTSKVNDANGNPIEIAAVVVWRVTDTARATFGVDDFISYVHTQSESAVRQLARSYPYDNFDDTDVTTLI